jgi:type I restriction enzyme S subunit
MQHSLGNYQKNWFLMSSNTWKKLSLADVAAWTSGGTPDSKNSSFYGGEIPWVVIGDLNEGKVVYTEKTLTELGLKNSNAKLLPEGTVMLAMYGASIGRTGYMGAVMATNQAIACATPNIGMVSAEYLLIFLQSQKRAFIAAGKGGAQPNISQGVIKNWKISLPSLDEQSHIVANFFIQLDKLKSAQRSIEVARNRANQLHSSILQAAITGELKGRT